MKTERVSRWTQTWDWVCSWWRAFHPHNDGDKPQRSRPPTPTQEKKERLSGSDKEYVSHLQAQIGVSPTEGHELTQDLHLTKCRSHGGGAPRSTTGFGRHPIQINLSEVCDEREDQDPTEVVREIGRSAIRDIRAKTEKR
jgi:hypothetical protein